MPTTGYALAREGRQKGDPPLVYFLWRVRRVAIIKHRELSKVVYSGVQCRPASKKPEVDLAQADLFLVQG